MEILSNPHTHTSYCDGSNTPEEMVLAAVKCGFTDIGFSGHAPVPFEDSATMSENALRSYCEEVNRLKDKYRNKIRISLGIELDYYSELDTSPFDYTISSLHWIQNQATRKYYTFDDTHEAMETCIKQGYGGNAQSLVEDYYRHMAELPYKMKPNIIGHFDLITKLNRGNRYFDEGSPEYQRTALKSLERATESGCIFEINTGGMFRGYTDKPYPAPFLLERLAQLNVPVIISSDAHCVEALDFRFNKTVNMLKEYGFNSTQALLNGKFEEIGL